MANTFSQFFLFSVLIPRTHQKLTRAHTKSSCICASYALFFLLMCACLSLTPFVCYLLRRCRKSCLNRKLNTFRITPAPLSDHNNHVRCTGAATEEKKITFFFAASSCLDISSSSTARLESKSRLAPSSNFRMCLMLKSLSLSLSHCRNVATSTLLTSHAEFAVDGWYLTD